MREDHSIYSVNPVADVERIATVQNNNGLTAHFCDRLDQRILGPRQLEVDQVTAL